MGLAVMTELPLVIVDVQRAGPSTGLPTKTEQADLLQAMFGRNGESPIAGRRPGHAGRLLRHGHRGVAHRAPVHDAGRLPVRRLPRQRRRAVAHPRRRRPARHQRRQRHRTADRLPSLRARPATLARPWAVPGHARPEHRIGGLEKDDITGNVSYDPDNHQHMTAAARRRRSPGSPTTIPDLEVVGPTEGDLLVLGWGGTYGAIRSRRRAPPRPRAARSPTPTCATSTRSRATPATSLGSVPPRAGPRAEPGPAAAADPRRATWSTRVGYNKVRASRSGSAEIVAEAERLLAA